MVQALGHMRFFDLPTDDIEKGGMAGSAEIAGEGDRATQTVRMTNSARSLDYVRLAPHCARDDSEKDFDFLIRELSHSSQTTA